MQVNSQSSSKLSARPSAAVPAVQTVVAVALAAAEVDVAVELGEMTVGEVTLHMSRIQAPPSAEYRSK